MHQEYSPLPASAKGTATPGPFSESSQPRKPDKQESIYVYAAYFPKPCMSLRVASAVPEIPCTRSLKSSGLDAFSMAVS